MPTLCVVDPRKTNELRYDLQALRQGLRSRTEKYNRFWCLEPTRARTVVEPRRPPKTNAGTETAFRHDNCKPREYIQKSKHLWGQKSVDTIKLASIYILSVTDFDQKGAISEVRVHAGAKFGHTGCWSIAKYSQSSPWRRTTQLDFEVDRPPPADSPAGDLFITMAKEMVILCKKEFRKMKKSETCPYLLLIWKWWKRYWLRDCLWLCQACKRGFRPT